ncbi:MAG: glutathione S-transferase [Granulosicoccus sp.]|jgi:glutathione S-transferase
MSRYVGKLCNLYPEDPMQALYCDEVLEALEDLNNYVVLTFGLKDEELINACLQLMEGRLTVFIKGLSELLKRGGGRYFATNQLTIADLKMLGQLKQLISGNLDHIPADFAQGLAPQLVEYFKQIEREAIVVAYYKSLNR